MRLLILTSLLGLFALSAACANGEVSVRSDDEEATGEEAYVLDFEMDRLEGGAEPLEDYKGDVVLMVNTASRCGLTPQYEGLQALYETYQDQGFTILGFPANNFMGQEPGTDEEIAQFCERNYGVTFPMFSKISVKGDDQHPLYARLTGLPEPLGGPVQWNFQKYLVDRDGRVVAKFSPRVGPDDPRLIEQLEALLGASASG